MSFHPIDGLNVQEQKQANVRRFEGDGTPYLKVPGCKAVKAVRLGNMELPMVLSQQFPVDAKGTQLHTVDSPMVSLQFQSDGMPILLRNTQSNDGMWQAGVPVFVQGDWEEEPASVVAEAPPVEPPVPPAPPQPPKANK